MTQISRRHLLAAGAACSLASPFARAQTPKHVVIIGAGFGGATTAKYLRKFNPQLKITIIEPSNDFVMCPMSNRVINGGMALRDITTSYATFMSKYRINWIKASADGIDPTRREVTVGKEKIVGDYIVVSPGVDYDYSAIGGLESPEAQNAVLHGWKAGEQTQRLREGLANLPKGGTVALHVPKVPYRCPPGPYERVSLIASYMKVSNPRGKIMVFDSNPEIQSKKGLFENVWKTQYPSLIDYIPNAEIESYVQSEKRLEFKVHGNNKADLINFIPPQRAGKIARVSGLANVGSRWCGVDFLTYESTAYPNIYVLGDSIASAPGLPKSGHMANQQAKVCAGAIAAKTLGFEVPSQPIIANTCYSFISATEAMHVAGVYKYDATKKSMVPVSGAGGLSQAPSVTEAIYAMSWVTNIMQDTLG
jgi:sulfide dehydrogenase [flavocytochrome c] flavoprotein chain